MPTTYKILGQAAPTPNTLTAVYTVPSATEAVISTITICNQTATNASYSISVASNGAADANLQYIIRGGVVPAADSIGITIGITANAADVIRANTSSANISFGGKTKISAILHGVFLLISAITISGLLNMIPLASLAAILIMVGYKLAKPELFKQMYKLGWEQFVPFMATIIAILLTDLLMGITIGMMFGIFYTLKHSYRNSHHLKTSLNETDGKQVYHMELAEEVSFFNKASVLQALEEIPENSKVIIDCTKSKSIAHDVVELIVNYRTNAKTKNIQVETVNFIEP